MHHKKMRAAAENRYDPKPNTTPNLTDPKPQPKPAHNLFIDQSV